MITVGKAKTGDFEKFYKLLKKTLSDGSFLYPVESREYMLSESLPEKARLKKNISKGKMALYIAKEGKKVVAYLLTDRDFAGASFAHWLGVDSKLRGKGIGSRLLALWEKEAVKIGVHALHLWTTENDLGFYKKAGFTLMGKSEKAWYGIDHFVFYKIIGTPNPKKYK